MTATASALACHGCANRGESLIQLGVSPGRWDYLIALAGNPNTGKSTIFNALTGLRQHTGNWPGKTVTRAEGSFARGSHPRRTWAAPDDVSTSRPGDAHSRTSGGVASKDAPDATDDSSERLPDRSTASIR